MKWVSEKYCPSYAGILPWTTRILDLVWLRQDEKLMTNLKQQIYEEIASLMISFMVPSTFYLIQVLK